MRHGVRTVQRWEQTEGLPVHRHPHAKRDAVYAYPPELDGWWTSRRAQLEKAEEGPAQPVPRRVWLIWSAACMAALLLAAAGAWLFRATRSHALGFSRRDWVLVTDFDNQTGDQLLDKSLITAFTVSLEQSTHANVLPRTRISAALRRMNRSDDIKIDEPVGREICVREHVKGLVSCSIARTGREYALSARLIDPQTGETVRSHIEPAKTQNQIIGSLGKIASRIRQNLGESLASIRQSDDPLPQLTTPSLQALRFFAEGNHLWRKGDYREAVKLYWSALEHDADFAMAHAALGSAYMSHIFSDPVQGKEHYEKALRRAERITDRERMYVQASYQSSLGHVEEAVQDYRAYLRA